MKKILAIIGILVVVSLVMDALGISSSENKKEPTTTEYTSAEDFERDLNDGYNLENVTVTFDVVEIKEKSVSGYNLWSGEHLNFLPEKKPDSISVGDVVTAKTTKIKKRMDSWFIDCEILAVSQTSRGQSVEESTASIADTPTITVIATETSAPEHASPLVDDPLHGELSSDSTSTATPAPTDSPLPTAVPSDTPTPKPTSTPSPKPTSTPTPEPTKTPTPKPTSTPTPKPSLDYTSNSLEKAKEGKTGYFAYVSDDNDSVKEYLFVDFDEGVVCIVDYDTKHHSESFGFVLRLFSGNLNSGVKANGYTEAGNFDFTFKFKKKNDPSRVVGSNSDGFYLEYVPTNYDKAYELIQGVEEVYDVSDPKHGAKNTPTPIPGNSGGSREVYITKTGECYHFKSSCVRNPIPVSLEDAKAMGYRACSKCAQ